LPTVAVWLTVALVAGCSSTSPGHVATVTSTPALPSTTTSTPKTAPIKCPAHAPTDLAPHQQPGTASTFVPGHPSELLGCRYHGDNQPQPVGSRATSASFAPGAIAAELNAARPVPKVINFMCPVDFGETVLLIFGYPDGSRLTVSIATAGCEFATNGDRRIFTPAATVTRLETVLGHDNR
jgi:hypothetical protein